MDVETLYSEYSQQAETYDSHSHNDHADLHSDAHVDNDRQDQHSDNHQDRTNC